MTVYIGTAGFSYKDWIGTFYPQRTAQRSMLDFYSKNFPVVEINSTYYAIPSPDSIHSMACRVPSSFHFNVKANREMTHEIKANSDVYERFLRAIRPLMDQGKLGCVLAQFPWSFRNNKDNANYLELLAKRLRGVDVVVEFRNSEWEVPETFDLLSELGLGYCCVDEPRLKGLLSPRVAVTSPVGYVRFHGRNYETWWARDRESWERYNYSYSEDELSEWVPKVEKIHREAERVYVIFNNHYKGQAPANAKTFERMLRAVIGNELKEAEPNDGGSSIFKWT